MARIIRLELIDEPLGFRGTFNLDPVLWEKSKYHSIYFLTIMKNSH